MNRLFNIYTVFALVCLLVITTEIIGYLVDMERKIRYTNMLLDNVDARIATLETRTEIVDHGS